MPPFAGQIEYRPANGQPAQVLAMMQNWVTSEGDAWTLTIDAVGRYFERVLAADKTLLAEPPATSNRLLENDYLKTSPTVQELIGGVYPSRAELLGKRTGELHLALAGQGAAGNPAMAPEAFNMLYQRSLLQSMSTLTRRVFTSLKRKISTLPEALRPEATRLLGLQGSIGTLQENVLRGRIPAMKMRIHGDYHLGQVLFTGKDFEIIDFEGEPARSLGERKLKRSPLADVAGMLRSFHYAAWGTLLQKVAAQPEDMMQLRPWAEFWYAQVAGSFLRSYLQTIAGAEFVPQDPLAFENLLQAFLLEKATYEVGYELNNRPDWIEIPIRGIARIMETQAS